MLQPIVWLNSKLVVVSYQELLLSFKQVICVSLIKLFQVVKILPRFGLSEHLGMLHHRQ